VKSCLFPLHVFAFVVTSDSCHSLHGDQRWAVNEYLGVQQNPKVSFFVFKKELLSYLICLCPGIRIRATTSLRVDEAAFFS
jgi:hypothetical protein